MRATNRKARLAGRLARVDRRVWESVSMHAAAFYQQACVLVIVIAVRPLSEKLAAGLLNICFPHET